ncbi:MAG: DUF4388 domain-containing protein [Candidatus Krumholzibacteria bacterium]|nr:DUF4388 domain-containing protein [Candidatus Krumholzibacteria bacterium]
MALEGNAKDFGLSEIFQLISIQKKSGMLSISGEENMAVFFEDGMVVSTRDRRSKTRDPLRDYLLRYGFLDREEMNNLQQIQSGSGMDLTDILLQERYFSDDELRQIFTDQIYETVQEILSWPKSYYKFVSGTSVLTGVRSFAAVKVEGLLMESMRRIDEFPEIRRIFRAEEMMVRRLPAEPSRKIPLERSEEVVYELLENESSVADVLKRAKMARFCAYEALKNLLEKELLEITRDVQPEQEKSPGEQVRERRSGGRKRTLPTMAAAAALALCYAAGEYAVPALFPPGWTADAMRAPAAAAPLSRDPGLSGDLSEFRLRRLETTVRQGLEEYRAVMGEYPFSLEILVVRKILPAGVVTRVHQAGLVYRAGDPADRYELSRG